jgi:hypothetical protein
MSLGWLYKSYQDDNWAFSEDEPDGWVYMKKQIVYCEII